MKKIIDFILYSNIWIALGSVSLCLESWFLHEEDINFWYLCFLFCGTFVIYNLHRIIGIKLFINNQGSNRFAKIMVFKKPITVLLIAFSIIGFYSFFQILDLLSTWFVIAMIASVFYVVPFYRYTRLRDFPFIKIFLIAICWSILCYIVPVEKVDWSLFSERILFMIAITIPFDIRDSETDQVSNTVTLVSWLGIEQSNKLAVLLAIAGFISLLLFVEHSNFGLPIIFYYLLFYILTCLLISKSSNNKKDIYFSGYLDGLIILRLGFFLVISLMQVYS